MTWNNERIVIWCEIVIIGDRDALARTQADPPRVEAITAGPGRIVPTLNPEKRAQILAGAGQVFAADGYEGASMARIAAVAGVSKGTLYNHFDSKAALFTCYVEGKCEAYLGNVFDDANHEDDPAGILHGIGTRMLRILLSETGLAIYRVVIADAGKFPELARAFHEFGPARTNGLLAEWLAEETRRGRLNVPDPAFAAEQFINLCQTRLVLRRRLEILRDPGDEAIALVVGAAVTMFMNSYSAPRRPATR